MPRGRERQSQCDAVVEIGSLQLHLKEYKVDVSSVTSFSGTITILLSFLQLILPVLYYFDSEFKKEQHR